MWKLEQNTDNWNSGPAEPKWERKQKKNTRHTFGDLENINLGRKIIFRLIWGGGAPSTEAQIPKNQVNFYKNFNLLETRVTLHRIYSNLAKISFGTDSKIKSTENQKSKNRDYPNAYLYCYVLMVWTIMHRLVMGPFLSFLILLFISSSS